jgi:hypothetical protein
VLLSPLLGSISRSGETPGVDSEEIILTECVVRLFITAMRPAATERRGRTDRRGRTERRGHGQVGTTPEY